MNRKERRMIEFGHFSPQRWQHNDSSRNMLSMDKDQVDAFWESFNDSRTLVECNLLWSENPHTCLAFDLDKDNCRPEDGYIYPIL
jgi:hypothetical protein